MTIKRNVFDAAFKLKVAEMVKGQGLGVAQVCRDMGLGGTAVRRWVRQLKADVSRLAHDRLDQNPALRFAW